MRRLLALAAAAAITVMQGCATIKEPFDLTEFNKAPPRSILVVPVVNRSLDVDAPNYVLSTLTVPLSELGYYVFPVNTVKVVLEQEGFYEAERIRQTPAADLATLFGADSVLFVTIKRWDAQYAVLATNVTVEFDYELVNKSGTTIWMASKRMVYSPQQNQQGHPLAILIAAAVSAAITRAAPNYLPLTQQANNMVFVRDNTKIPSGPYATDKP